MAKTYCVISKSFVEISSLRRKDNDEERRIRYELLLCDVRHFGWDDYCWLLKGHDGVCLDEEAMEGIVTNGIWRCRGCGRIDLPTHDDTDVECRPCPVCVNDQQWESGEGRIAPSATATPGSANDIRALGWAVAVHNDYRVNGEAYTFWLFTKGDKCLKGEGKTDEDALNDVRYALRRFYEEKI